MSWLHRKSRDAPATVVNNYYGIPETRALANPTDGDDEEGAGPTRDELIEKAVHDIRLQTSAWARFKQWMADLGWVTFLLGGISIAILPTEWYLTVLTVAVANALMYGYTKWVYKPPVVPVVKYDDEGGGGVLSAHLIPTRIWDNMVKEGLTNTIQTSHGPTYMVRSITWDAERPGQVPVAVEFSWLHYNELNFATKRGMFEELAKLNQITTEENNRYKWLMGIITMKLAVKMYKGWVRRTSNGRFDPLSMQDEANLRAELEKLAREGEKLQMSGLEGDELQAFSAESESGVVP